MIYKIYYRNRRYLIRGIATIYFKIILKKTEFVTFKNSGLQNTPVVKLCSLGDDGTIAVNNFGNSYPEKKKLKKKYCNQSLPDVMYISKNK